jgi:manganese/zinc/iron transport system permease protein
LALPLVLAIPGAACGTPTPAAHNHSAPSRVTSGTSGTSLSDNRFRWPGWQKISDTLLLKQYNTRIVLLGTILLGTGAGTVGTFMLLRKRSLVGDVVSHASLPGIAMAFLAVEMSHPGKGRSLPVLLFGALLAGLLGVLCTIGIRRFSRIKEDTALAIVLSVFFGIGIALFTIIQKLPTGQVAGLQQFIYGQTASMTAADVGLIGLASILVIAVSAALFKEFSLLCFDEEFGRSHGWPTLWLDLALMALVVCIAITGLQSVGLLLVVAMLIIPPAAARFWTDRLASMTVIAAVLGGLSAWLGGVASSLFARFSAGAVIVLAGTLFFLASLALGTKRGLLPRIRRQWSNNRRIGRHDLLRTLYEMLEPHLSSSTSDSSSDPLGDIHFTSDQVLSRRSWSRSRLSGLLDRATRDGLLKPVESRWKLTAPGAREARLVARNHRLWETYLILHADIAPNHVDRDADLIEHVLEPDLVSQLLETVAARYPQMEMPPSPHPLEPGI